MTEIWTRPWALGQNHWRLKFDGRDQNVPTAPGGPLWVYSPNGPQKVNGLHGVAETVAGFAFEGQSRRHLGLLPMPLRRDSGTKIAWNETTNILKWQDRPERPYHHKPATETEILADRLMQRTRSVRDRLADVEDAMADPLRLWPEVKRRWTETDAHTPPAMDVIVRQARELRFILDHLDRAPRRILRRQHDMVPLGRVQEMDRKALAWLIRQPGETLAERAGDRQRILAVTRTENFNTLENRVLRSYAELAADHARQYCERNGAKSLTLRFRRVDDFKRRCQRLARDLADRGVQCAEAGVTPNNVLLENARYAAVWRGWLELLGREPQEDELWRWQARSWEEFVALAVMVALVGIDEARLIAASPIEYRDEQFRGLWLDHDNPLGVFYLPQKKLVVEVQYRLGRLALWRSDLCAPIWIRYGRTTDQVTMLRYVAVWPIWDVQGGPIHGETSALSALLAPYGSKGLVGSLVVRPTAFEGSAHVESMGRATTVSIAPAGEALASGIGFMAEALSSALEEVG